MTLFALFLLQNSFAGWADYWPFSKIHTQNNNNQDWDSLSEKEQKALIQRYEQLKDTPKNQNVDLQQRMEWFTQLPEQEKQKMRDAWQKMSLQERKDLAKRMQKASSNEERTLIRHEYIEKYLTQE